MKININIVLTVDTFKDGFKEIVEVSERLASVYKPKKVPEVKLGDDAPIKHLVSYVHSRWKTRFLNLIDLLLRVYGVVTIKDLSYLTNYELYSLRNCGKGTIYAIRYALKSFYEKGEVDNAK